MFSASGSSGRAGALFAHSLLTGSSHHESTMVPFPEPFGERRCLEVGADGDGVLRKKVGEVPLRHYLCMQPRALQGMLLALNRARLIGLMPTASFTAGTRKVPPELSDEPICEWVAVSRGGKRLAAQTLAGQGLLPDDSRGNGWRSERRCSDRTPPPTAGRGCEASMSSSRSPTSGPPIEERGITIRKQPVDSVARPPDRSAVESGARELRRRRSSGQASPAVRRRGSTRRTGCASRSSIAGATSATTSGCAPTSSSRRRRR